MLSLVFAPQGFAPGSALSHSAIASRSTPSSMIFGLFDTKEEAARPLPTVAPPTINPPTVKGVVLPTKAEAKSPQMSATPAQTGAAMSVNLPISLNVNFAGQDVPITIGGSASAPAAAPTTTIEEGEVLEAQAEWANAIREISLSHKRGGDYISVAGRKAGQLYGYGHSNVLFKPTKAAEVPFRPTANEAMSYFVGGDVIDGGYDEDGGFAINGGKGWESVVFNNHQIEIDGNVAIAMGSYDFTCATTGDVATVEYTFGYKRSVDGKLRIFLHHSSVPYNAGAPAPTTEPVTEAEVLDVQKNWAAAIAQISKVHKEGGDYIGAAGEAAGNLYGYGHGNVLFKPTKATKNPFRPTGEDAMSYFVGAKAMENPKYEGEDAGFAINGGKGWASCVYKNHQIELQGDIAIAMGTYDFTCATTGDVATVEYTFGYKRCDDGKVRIFMHHSSVPYSA